MPTMVDARVYFTDSEKPPDDLAALMLNLGLAMSQSQPKPHLKRRPSTGSSIKPISVDGVPDFEYILQGINLMPSLYKVCFKKLSSTGIQAQNLAWGGGRVFTRKASHDIVEGPQEYLQFTVRIGSVHI